jgi:hypothetical protein
MRDRCAIVIRGPNGTGKSQTIAGIQAAWNPGSTHHVTLDHGWGHDPNPLRDWRRETQGAARYRDLVDADARAAQFLVIEIGTAEPFNGNQAATGATRDPREWMELLTDRSFLYFRLSVSRQTMEARLLDRKRRRGEPAIVHPDEGEHHDRIEHDSWRVRFHERARVVEHVLDTEHIDYAEAARIILRHLPVALPSP